MQVLCSIVQPFVGTVLEGWHDLAFCGGVGSQLAGDHPLWRYALLFQPTNKQAFGSELGRLLRRR
jgi:hypothetical protein